MTERRVEVESNIIKSGNRITLFKKEQVNWAFNKLKNLEKWD